MTTYNDNPLDNLGATVEAGVTVAFNLSGQIAKGQVESVRCRDRLIIWGPGVVYDWTIRVKLLHDAAGKPAGHVSKVTDPRNVLVLRSGTDVSGTDVLP
jgi:hypothetical protein